MDNFLKILIAITISQIYTNTLYAQTSPGKYIYIETNLYYGFVVPHHDFISYFIEDHVKGYQVNIGLHTSGNKKWQQYYNYPNIGIGFYHSGLGNNEIFGQMSAVFTYVERFFLKPHRTFNIGNRIAYGISYINKRYDINNNNFDMAIGSHLNVYLNYSAEGTWKITPQLTFKLGVGLIHTSNGSFHLPNKGLNLVTSFVGLQYSFQPISRIQPVNLREEEEEEGKNQFMIMFETGHKQIEITSTKTANPIALSAEYGRKIVRTGWIGSSINLYYDPSIQKKMEWAGGTVTKWNNLRLSLNLSYELRMGKLGYIFQPGIYLINKYTVTGVINNRLGLRYHINPHLVTSVTIKAHWFAIADFVEFGIGYRWSKKVLSN
jgi:hypothetical protein